MVEKQERFHPLTRELWQTTYFIGEDTYRENSREFNSKLKDELGIKHRLDPHTYTKQYYTRYEGPIIAEKSIILHDIIIFEGDYNFGIEKKELKFDEEDKKVREGLRKLIENLF